MNESVLKQAKEIASQALSGECNPNVCCEILADLCHKNGWPEFLVEFSALAHEQTGHEEFGMTKENSVPLILEACRKLLEVNP